MRYGHRLGRTLTFLYVDVLLAAGSLFQRPVRIVNTPIESIPMKDDKVGFQLQLLDGFVVKSGEVHIHEPILAYTRLCVIGSGVDK